MLQDSERLVGDPVVSRCQCEFANDDRRRQRVRAGLRLTAEAAAWPERLDGRESDFERVRRRRATLSDSELTHRFDTVTEQLDYVGVDVPRPDGDFAKRLRVLFADLRYQGFGQLPAVADLTEIEADEPKPVVGIRAYVVTPAFYLSNAEEGRDAFAGTDRSLEPLLLADSELRAGAVVGPREPKWRRRSDLCELRCAAK